MRFGVGVSGFLPVILLLLVASSPGLADPVSVSLVFTSFQDQGTPNGGPNVYTVSFSWNGTTVSLGAATPLATTNGADGIVINPLNGNYLIGGQQNGLVNQITPSGAAVSSVASNNVTALGDVAGAYHLKVDPSG